MKVAEEACPGCYACLLDRLAAIGLLRSYSRIKLTSLAKSLLGSRNYTEIRHSVHKVLHRKRHQQHAHDAHQNPYPGLS